MKQRVKKYDDDLDGSYYAENDDYDYVDDDYENSKENVKDSETEKVKP